MRIFFAIESCEVSVDPTIERVFGRQLNAHAFVSRLDQVTHNLLDGFVMGFSWIVGEACALVDSECDVWSACIH